MSDGFWKILALKGIKGGGDTPTQEKTVALDMANGNQIITSDDGKTMTQATVLKPATMVAENIKSGVNIGGVVGSLVIPTNKLPQVVDGTITELTAEDLAGVTKIKNQVFNACRELLNVTIPDSVTSIGDSAFYGCSGLTSITIPDSVTSIGIYAFAQCNKLADIGEYNNFETIGDFAFNSCNLEHFYISKKLKSLGSYAFVGNKIKRIDITMNLKEYCEMPINMSGLKNTSGDIIGYLYINNERLPQDLIIPEQTSKVCEGAFYGEQIKSVTVPDSVTVIGQAAFKICKSLGSVMLGDGIKEIKKDTFSGCLTLTNITIPDSVTSIGDSAFYGCSGLTSITIPDSVTSIGIYALQIGTMSNKATITMLSPTPPSIASNAFAKSYLNKIIVPKGTGDTYKAATNWAAFADYIEEAAE